MLSYIQKNNYLVLYPDKTIKLYTSLRDIEKDILISPSSISKKMKNNRISDKWCICVSKGSKYTFFIEKLMI